MIRLFILVLWFWSTAASALYVVERNNWQTTLQQPVALAWNMEGRLAILDGSGLGFFLGNNIKLHSEMPIPASALDVSPYKEYWLIADPANNRVLRLDNKGKLLHVIDTKLTKDSEKKPEPVAVIAYQDVLFWADRANHRICRYDLLKNQEIDCFGRRGEKEGEFQYPYQMTFDRDGYLHVVDILNARIQIFDKQGRFTYSVGRFGSGKAELFRPNGIANDPEHDLLFVSDSYFGTIKLFKGGESLGELTDHKGSAIRLKSPTGLTWRDGMLYVAETLNNSVVALKLSDFGTIPSAPKLQEDESLTSQKNCLICHLSWAKEGNAPDEQGILPEASYAMCYSCHNGAVWDSRFQIGRGAQHASLYDKSELREKRDSKKREDKLPKKFPHTDDNELPCTSCHTPHTKDDNHETIHDTHKNSWLRVINRSGDMCERCHESKTESAREKDAKDRGVNHPLDIKMMAPPSSKAPGYASDKNMHKGLPDKLNHAGGALGNDKELVCQSCHQVHGGHDDRAMIAMEDDKGQLCATCHERQFSDSDKDARHKGIHPVNIKPKDPMKHENKEIKFVTCATCHKVHSGQQGTALLEEGIKDSEALCQICHKRQHEKGKDEALKKGIHPVDFKLEEEVEIKGKKIKEVGCLSCHSVHAGEPDTPALVAEHLDGQLCSHCHEGKQAVVGSDHDLRITAKDKVNRYKELPHKTGVCSSCHSMHRGENEQPHLFSAKWINSVDVDKDAHQSDLTKDKLCLNCHQKEGIGKDKIVKWFNHPHEDMVLRSDKTVMPLLGKEEKIKKMGQIACITCHEPHFWDPDTLAEAKKSPKTVKPAGFTKNKEGTPLNSFLRTKGVVDTFCVECHGLEALTKFKYYHDKTLVRNIGVDYLK
jgi:predicted CXXCH cytochrome family protein